MVSFYFLIMMFKEQLTGNSQVRSIMLFICFDKLGKQNINSAFFIRFIQQFSPNIEQIIFSGIDSREYSIKLEFKNPSNKDFNNLVQEIEPDYFIVYTGKIFPKRFKIYGSVDNSEDIDFKCILTFPVGKHSRSRYSPEEYFSIFSCQYPYLYKLIV